MKIEINVKDITLFANALNNAIATYGDIIFGIFIGCGIPEKFKPLEKISNEELEKRIECLKDVYKQIEEIERRSE